MRKIDIFSKNTGKLEISNKKYGKNARKSNTWQKYWKSRYLPTKNQGKILEKYWKILKNTGKYWKILKKLKNTGKIGIYLQRTKEKLSRITGQIRDNFWKILYYGKNHVLCDE